MITDGIIPAPIFLISFLGLGKPSKTSQEVFAPKTETCFEISVGLSTRKQFFEALFLFYVSLDFDRTIFLRISDDRVGNRNLELHFLE